MITNKILSDKKGADKILGVYWFAVLILVSAGVFAMVYSFQIPYDVRGVETSILTGKVAECIAPLGVLDLSFLSLGGEFDYNSIQEVNSEDLGKAFSYANGNSVNGRTCNCGESCGSYSDWVYKYSQENEIFDPLLLLSIMMQESSCNYESASGSSVGLMQINLIHCKAFGLPSDEEECKNFLINNPEKNIEIGAKILRDSYEDVLNRGGERQFSDACTPEYQQKTYSGWEAAVRGYNGWGCGVYRIGPNKGEKITAQDYYADEVMERYSQLREAIGKPLPGDIVVSDVENKCNLNFNDKNNEEEQYYLRIKFENLDTGVSKIVQDGNINFEKDCEVQKEDQHEVLSRCSESSLYSVDAENNKYLIKILSLVRKTEQNVR